LSRVTFLFSRLEFQVSRVTFLFSKLVFQFSRVTFFYSRLVPITDYSSVGKGSVCTAVVFLL
jgi:hypothetical protein